MVSQIGDGQATDSIMRCNVRQMVAGEAFSEKIPRGHNGTPHSSEYYPSLLPRTSFQGSRRITLIMKEDTWKVDRYRVQSI